MSRRVALLTEIPAPFRIPLFEELARRPAITFQALFLAARDPRRPYSGDDPAAAFDRQVLPGWQFSRGSRWIVVNRRVVTALLRFRPQVVIVGGWNQPAFWEALVWTRITRTPLVVWVESTSRDARRSGAALERAKQAMLGAADGFLVPGVASRSYLESLGVDPARIHTAPNAVDRALFRDTVDVLRARRAALRSELGLTRPTIVTVCRLDPEKGVDKLIEACRGIEVDLVVVGAGRDAKALRAVAPSSVRFLGALAPAEVARWYAAADVFALASTSEQWGMVLNEAAEAGLPIVATDAAGAAHDLVRDGDNGFLVPAGDVAALAAALARLVADSALRARAGARSRELVMPFTATAWADAVEALAAELAR